MDAKKPKKKSKSKRNKNNLDDIVWDNYKPIGIDADTESDENDIQPQEIKGISGVIVNTDAS